MRLWNNKIYQKKKIKNYKNKKIIFEKFFSVYFI